MGIGREAMRALCATRRAGGAPERVLTLGRQRYADGRAPLLAALREAGLPDRELPPDAAFEGWAEPLFTALGARSVEALDASDFEGAQHVHDLNRAPPPDLEGAFDWVFDGGTLEHVFEFGTALRGALALVRPGGRFISQNPAFGFAGHGFVQFAPELWFQALGAGSGFRLRRLLLLEHYPGGRWYRVRDPEEVRGRVEIGGAVRCLLHVEAERIDSSPPLPFVPQQSDYASSWASGRERRRERRRGGREFARRIPGLDRWLARRKARRLLARLAPDRQPDRFTPTDLVAECHSA